LVYQKKLYDMISCFVEGS